MTQSQSSIRFGTDGWRALIAETFTFENVRTVGQALADELIAAQQVGRGVAIGYDTRFLSGRFAEALAGVLGANHIPVLLSDAFCPTPLLSFAVRERGLAAGIMVTASHNPWHYNGIKFKSEWGGPFMPEQTRAVESRLFRTAVRRDEALARKLVEPTDFFAPYARHIGDYFDWTRITASPLRLVCDAMHGAGCGFLRRLLPPGWGESRFIGIGQNPHPLFANRLPEPILVNLGALAAAVPAHGADLGLATDGDADRFGVLDHQGRFVELHDLMPLFFRHLVTSRGWPGDVVRTTSMAATIDRMAAAAGRRVIEVPVGFKHVAEEMLRQEILIGGEESGGFGYHGHLPERDGLFSCLMTLELLAASGATLAELVQQLRREYGPFAYGRIDHPYAPEILHKNMQTLRQEPPGRIGRFKVASINPVDGIKFYFDEGSWMLLRLSDTEPLGRIYAGSERQDKVQQLLEEGKNLLTQPPPR
ncbi:MAG TPA: phosphoglucomutase/phosphomannomutase family protein [bacterium]|nr:phosphoglucomutase/phosphomannomutase family protein [bacterium]